MKGNAPERLVSGSDDFTMFLWEPFVSKHPKTRMTGHQQVQIFHNQLCLQLQFKLFFILGSARLLCFPSFSSFQFE